MRLLLSYCKSHIYELHALLAATITLVDMHFVKKPVKEKIAETVEEKKEQGAGEKKGLGGIPQAVQSAGFSAGAFDGISGIYSAVPAFPSDYLFSADHAAQRCFRTGGIRCVGPDNLWEKIKRGISG